MEIVGIPWAIWLCPSYWLTRRVQSVGAHKTNCGKDFSHVVWNTERVTNGVQSCFEADLNPFRKLNSISGRKGHLLLNFSAQEIFFLCMSQSQSIFFPPSMRWYFVLPLKPTLQRSNSASAMRCDFDYYIQIIIITVFVWWNTTHSVQHVLSYAKMAQTSFVGSRTLKESWSVCVFDSFYFLGTLLQLTNFTKTSNMQKWIHFS